MTECCCTEAGSQPASLNCCHLLYGRMLFYDTDGIHGLSLACLSGFIVCFIPFSFFTQSQMTARSGPMKMRPSHHSVRASKMFGIYSKQLFDQCHF